jgi:choline kinase
MKAIVLAAGRGSRMEDGTATIPKCLMTLCGRTLLERCIERLTNAGFATSDIGVVTGYMHEKISVEGARLFHNADWESTNMFYSLTMASEWLRQETCIISYSDIVYSPFVVKMLMESESDLAITYYTGFWELWKKRFENPLEDLETFKLCDEKLIEIGKKPTSKSDVHGQYMGLLRFTPSGWKTIEYAITQPMTKTVAKLDMTTLLQHLISLGHDIKAIKTDELWLECDNQHDIQVFQREYENLL